MWALGWAFLGGESLLKYCCYVHAKAQDQTHVVDEVEVEDEVVVVLVVALNLPLLSSSRRPRARRIMWSCRSQGQGQSEEKRKHNNNNNNNNKRTNDGSVPPPIRALLAIKGKQVQLIIALTSEAHSPLSRHTKAIIR